MAKLPTIPVYFAQLDVPYAQAELKVHARNARHQDQPHISLSLEQQTVQQAVLMANIAMFLSIVALSATLTALHVWGLPQIALAAG